MIHNHGIDYAPIITQLIPIPCALRLYRLLVTLLSHEVEPNFFWPSLYLNVFLNTHGEFSICWIFSSLLDWLQRGYSHEKLRKVSLRRVLSLIYFPRMFGKEQLTLTRDGRMITVCFPSALGQEWQRLQKPRWFEPGSQTSHPTPPQLAHALKWLLSQITELKTLIKKKREK